MRKENNDDAARRLKFCLVQLVADVVIVGVPNAGKSTLFEIRGPEEQRLARLGIICLTSMVTHLIQKYHTIQDALVLVVLSLNTKVISVRLVQMLADSVLTVLSHDPENFSYNCGPEVPIRSFTLLLSGDLGYVNIFELSPSCRKWTSQ